MRSILFLSTLPFWFACATPSKATLPERQKITNQDRDRARDDEGPLKAPPPSYGNKVVEGEKEKPETEARDEVDDCRVPDAKGGSEGPTETECNPTPTTTMY
jgi:hypothetical protein